MRWLWWTVLLLAPVLSGCVGGPGENAAVVDDEVVDGVTVPQEVKEWVPPDVVWDTSKNYSLPLRNLGLDILPVEWRSFTASDGVRIDTAVWRPKLPDGEKVPVILDVGPYYEDSIEVIPPDSREDVFFLQGFVQNGYAYGRVSIRGTSSAGGCMEFFSLREQQDVDEAVTYFGSQPWSSGAVALYGASYDGTTPWMAAMFGNPYLKTVVPVSGLTDIAGLMFRNGTSEDRGDIMHTVVYWPFGLQTTRRTPEDKAANINCMENIEGAVAGPYTANTGDRDGVGPTQGYWAERDFRQRVKDNYQGSVYLVHGLQDWNVEATMAYPFVNELEAQGLRVKHMLGQWGHDWPDRKSRETSVRWDWSELLLRWFDQELKGVAQDKLGAPVDVQDDKGFWRTELTWPPRDLAWHPYHLGANQLAHDEATQPGQASLYDPAQAFSAVPRPGALPADVDTRGVSSYEASLGPVDEDFRFAGLARLHATVTPATSEGARLYVELVDESPQNQRKIVAHGVMDLRYYQGGWERQELEAGQPVRALIEFFPADVLIEKGHDLILRVTAGNRNNGTQEHPAPTPVTLHWGDGQSVLYLPVITRDVGPGKYPGQPPLIEVPDGGGALPFPLYD